jgi:hypothetical protein
MTQEKENKIFYDERVDKKISYKYIYFILIQKKPKTDIWSCYNAKNDWLLGQIKWYSGWRQYCYFPENALFSRSCLLDIADFLKKINKEHKE